MSAEFDYEVDFLVAGSGVGGFTGAITAKKQGLKTLIIEKGDKFGGSSALSGGGQWIPNAPAQVRDGYSLDAESVVEYMHLVTKGAVSDERIRAYLSQGPKMMEFLEKTSDHIQFVWKPDHADYFPELPGGDERGSLISVKEIDLRKLGQDREKLLPPHAIAPKGVWIGPNELIHFYHLRQSWKGKLVFAKLFWRMVWARISGTKMVTGGQALIARHFLTYRDLGGELWLNSPIKELITDNSGAVLGAVVDHDGKLTRVRAKYGVLIATGGFEANQEMRDKYQPKGKAIYSLANRINTGDGINVASAAGAELATMDSAWWYPAVSWAPGKVQFSLNERMLASMVIVNQAGNRYLNEAMPYSEFGFAMIEADNSDVTHIPSWLIIDNYSFRKYNIFGHLPLPKIPFAPAPTGGKVPQSWLDSGVVKVANTVEELAKQMDVPVENLQATVDRYNKIAATGKDTDFGRGDSKYDQWYADITLEHPNLAPFHGGPYMAFKIILSDLGTNGGIMTDEHARAVSADGKVISGLYATGNVSSSVMGRSYAGAGATLGPSATFGFIAANDAVSKANSKEGDAQKSSQK